MKENAIDKAFKNIVGNAAEAGGIGRVIDLIADLDEQMRLFNKRYNGTVGGQAIEQLHSAQFQTYHRPNDFPDKIRVAGYSHCPDNAGIIAMPIVPTGKARIVAVSLAAEPNHTMDISMLEVRWQDPIGLWALATLSVSGFSPFASITFPEPFPTSTSLPGESVSLERFPIQCELFGAGGANLSTITVYWTEWYR